MNQRLYAVGDIHGHLDKLEGVHARIRADRLAVRDDGAPVIHVGDLVDRGPNSKGVIDFFLAGQKQGEPWYVLLGNHDRLLLKFLDDPSWCDPRLRTGLWWLSQNMGGLHTLASYGLDAHGAQTLAEIHQDALGLIPESHHRFLAALPLYYDAGEILLVHAGIRPGVALKEQSEDDLVWIRREFHDHHASHGPLIIHGHSVVPEVMHYGNRVNIDTGAGWGDPVSAIVVEGREVFVLEEQGRRRLEPATA